jgi:putative transposase
MKQYLGLEADRVREMKHLQDKNGRLKQWGAELSLDETMLQDVLRKKW